MKLKFLLLLFVFSAYLVNGQEIKLNAALVSSAGSSSELGTVNILKWRLGKVHLIVLDQNDLGNDYASSWNVRPYPNPFSEVLNFDFETDEATVFKIHIRDVVGKTHWLGEEKTIAPNQTLSLNLGHLAGGVYIVSMISNDKKIQRVFKILKH